jgi:hypothetical protein
MVAREQGIIMGISQIVRELEGLRQDQVSGDYYVVAETGERACVVLQAGKVIKIRVGKTTHTRILDALAGLRVINTQFVEAGGATHRLAPRVGRQHIGNGGLQELMPLDARTKAVVTKHLIPCLGPVAAVVCDEEMRVNQNLEGLLTAVSNAIDDPAEAHKFREAVRDELFGTRSRT